MGISGLIGAGASDGLDEIIVQQLAKQKFAEQIRAQQAQESIQQARLAQDAQQHGDVMGMRRRQQDFEEQAYQDETQKRTIDGMRKVNADHEAKFTRLTNEDEAEGVLSDPGSVSPLRRIVALDRIGVKAGAGDVATPEEQQAATEADIANYGRKMGAGADAQARAAARYREPKQAGPGGLQPAQITTAKQFQDDYARDSKTYITVRNAYQQVASAADNPDGAGDLSLLFGYMKMLDPNSVVRETEFANAESAMGYAQKVLKIPSRAINGTRLNPQARQMFKQQAQRIFQSAHDNQQRVRKTYGDRASKFGIDPSMVLDDDEPMPEAGAAPAPAATPTRRIKMDRNGNPIGE